MPDQLTPFALYPARPEADRPRSNDVAPDRRPTPSLLDSIPAAFRVARDEDSLNQANRLKRAWRDLADDLARDGLRPREGFSLIRSTRSIAGDTVQPDRVWTAVQRARQRDPRAYPAVPATREAFEEQVLTRNGARRRDQDVSERGGLLPQLTGGVGASFLDPVNVATLPVGAAKGAGWAARIGFEALLNTGVEALETPLRIDAKARMGEETTAGDVALNLGAAGVFGAVAPPAFHVGGKAVAATARGAAATGRGVGRLLGTTADALGTAPQYRTPAGDLAGRMRAEIGADRMTPDELAAVRDLDREHDTLATSPFEPGAGSAAHLERMDAAEVALAEGPAPREAPIAPPPGRPRGAPDPFANTRAPGPSLYPRGQAAETPRAGALRAPLAVNRTARDQVKARIARHESGGDDTARNPLSTATGRYQVIDGTWLTIARQFPWATGLDDAALLARRSQPAAQEAVMDRLLDGYAARLQRIGAPETPGNLYLLHFLGEGGGTRTLRAAADTPMSQLVTPAAMAANRAWLEGKTAGQLIADMHRRMGGDVHSGPVLRRDQFGDDDAGDAEWARAQGDVDRAEAELAAARRAEVEADRPRTDADDDDYIPGFDDAEDARRAAATGRDPFDDLDDSPPSIMVRGEDDVEAFWASQQANGRGGNTGRRTAVWTVRDGEGRMVDWGHSEQDALDRAAAHRLLRPAIEEVKPGKLARATESERAPLQPTVKADATGENALLAASLARKGEPGVRVEDPYQDGSYVFGVFRDEAGDAKGTVWFPLEPDHEGARRLISYVDPAYRRQGIATQMYEALRAAGHDVDALSGATDLTPDGAAFVNARRGRLEARAADLAGAADDGSPRATVRGFDHPDDVAAAVQIESLEHDLRQWLADDEATGATVRLNEDGDVVSAADAMADLDADDAAIEAAWACLK